VIEADVACRHPGAETAKRTIEFTASYLTGTPCTEEMGDAKTDVELKGALGT
jgi:hypothetical protein